MTSIDSPVLIAVAPNGARHPKSAHAALPLSPGELAKTASSCANAGAGMIHLHVRDEHGRHSLEPRHYRPAIAAIREAVDNAMLIQVTSEAAGVYTADQQIQLISALRPDSVSIALRELFSDSADVKAGSHFLDSLMRWDCLVQYILYSPAEVRRYRRLLGDGVIPSGRHWLLFVLGRYTDSNAVPDKLQDYVDELADKTCWMVCAFGQAAFATLSAAPGLGGHIRIGFENGWLLPDGSVAPDNAALIRVMAERIRASGAQVATAADFMDRSWD